MPNNEQPPTPPESPDNSDMQPDAVEATEAQAGLQAVPTPEGASDITDNDNDEPTPAQEYWRRFGPPGGDKKKLQEVIDSDPDFYFEIPTEDDREPETPAEGKVLPGPWSRDEEKE